MLLWLFFFDVFEGVFKFLDGLLDFLELCHKLGSILDQFLSLPPIQLSEVTNGMVSQNTDQTLGPAKGAVNSQAAMVVSKRKVFRVNGPKMADETMEAIKVVAVSLEGSANNEVVKTDGAGEGGWVCRITCGGGCNGLRH